MGTRGVCDSGKCRVRGGCGPHVRRGARTISAARYPHKQRRSADLEAAIGTHRSRKKWDRTIDTNLKGCFLCTQRAARRMREQGGGRIVNIGSGCNKVAFPNLVDYTPAKAVSKMFTKVAAVELGRYHITVNCVAPGVVEIERTKNESGDYAGTWAKLTPLGRVRAACGCGARRSVPGERCGGVYYGADDLGRWGLFSKPSWPYE